MSAKGFLIKAGVAVAAFAVATTGSAQDRLKDHADLYLKRLYTHDDNLFQTQDKKNDHYYTWFLGVDAEAGSSEARFGLTGEVRDKHYDHFSDQDDTEYDLSPRAVFGGNMLTLGIYGQFLHSISPVDSTNVTRVESDTDKGWVTLTGAPSNGFGFELTAGLEDKYYDGFDGLEYFKNDFSISGYNMLSDKTKVGLKYYWADHDYDDAIRFDAVTTRISAFVDHAITGKLTSHIELGRDNVDFDTDNGTIADEDDAVAEPYIAVSLTYTPTDRWQLDAGISRQVYQSSSATSNFYTDTVSNLGVTFKATSKVTVNVGGRYTQTVENNTFDSDTIGATAKVDYSIQEWVGLEFGYAYTDRDSDSPTGSYDRNIGSAGFVLRW